MQFNSFTFALFLIIVFSLYWILPPGRLRMRQFLLIVASYVFYGWWDWRFLILIFISCLVDFFIARGIDEAQSRRRKKMLLGISLFVQLGILCTFKYFDFFTTSFAALLNSLGFTVHPVTLNLVLPAGVSFYTFQTLSYTIDVYRGNMKASKDPFAFFAFVSFFPQLVAGPIERATHLLPQFEKPHLFNENNCIQGLRIFLWGFFKKVVIADNCAYFANIIFDNYSQMSGLELSAGAVFFAFHIYGDFSGYSDMAVGSAKLFGYDLMQNFRTPYFSRDIAEFWRRWHISLSTWFRDYLYIPLGGSRGGKSKAVRNTFIIFLVSGLWHGANWTFVVWGLLNAIYFLPLLLRNKNRSHLEDVAANRLLPNGREIFQILITFTLTCIAWVFFRSQTIEGAFGYLKGIVTNPFLPGNYSNFSHRVFVPLAIFIALDWSIFRWFDAHERIVKWSSARKWAFIGLILLITLLYYQNEASSFIYFQF